MWISEAVMETRELIEPLLNRASWIKFVGVILAIVGVLSCLTVIGIPFGIISIILSVTLIRASKRLAEYRENNDDHMVRESLDGIARFFKYTGIVTILGICIYVIGTVSILVLVLWELEII